MAKRLDALKVECGSVRTWGRVGKPVDGALGLVGVGGGIDDEDPGVPECCAHVPRAPRFLGNSSGGGIIFERLVGEEDDFEKKRLSSWF